ncbi:hypothetical protein [Streptomyces alboflavus]|uniref:hypothetical protein n=1 Tax=Streptomyces alboflavus TaxID=67267 RepID=UPI0004C130DE|nr:hypothetical protein [Streptomyces alboflavus]
MLRGAWSGGRGRRGAIAGASAVVLGLGGLVVACGGDGRDGFVATGAAGGGPEKGSGKAVGPGGDVEFVPLDGKPSGSPSEGPPRKGSGVDGTGRAGGDDGRSPGEGSPGAGARGGTAPDGKSPGGSAGSGSPGAQGDSSTGHGEGGGADDDGTRPGPPSDTTPGPGTPPKPGPNPDPDPKPNPDPKPKPPTPAILKVGEPRRAAGDKRWCEDVTVSFRNTGGSAARSGSVTFGTHIIGALGVDWGTIESTRKLPAPIEAGRTVKKTWPVCVDWWRVPLGMRVETRVVDVEWK